MTALCGAFGTCIGAWVKVFSVGPDLFYVGFIGQSIVATSQVSSQFTLLLRIFIDWGINWKITETIEVPFWSKMYEKKHIDISLYYILLLWIEKKGEKNRTSHRNLCAMCIKWKHNQ